MPPEPMAFKNSIIKENCAKGNSTLKIPNHTRNHIPKRKGRGCKKQKKQYFQELEKLRPSDIFLYNN